MPTILSWLKRFASRQRLGFQVSNPTYYDEHSIARRDNELRRLVTRQGLLFWVIPQEPWKNKKFATVLFSMSCCTYCRLDLLGHPLLVTVQGNRYLAFAAVKESFHSRERRVQHFRCSREASMKPISSLWKWQLISDDKKFDPAAAQSTAKVSDDQGFALIANKNIDALRIWQGQLRKEIPA